MPKPGFPINKFLAEAGACRTVGAYAEGNVIFAQGDPADSILYIREGRIKLTVVSEGGKEAVIALLTVGDFCGEGCLTAQQCRMASATALTDCSILQLEKATALAMLHGEPAFAELLLSYMLARTMRIEEDLVDQLFNSSEKRLARTLLLLANFGKEGSPEKVIPKITQQMLAEIVGTTRSRVSFFMNKFRRLGYIQYDDRVEVHSSLLNVVRHV